MCHSLLPLYLFVQLIGIVNVTFYASARPCHTPACHRTFRNFGGGDTKRTQTRRGAHREHEIEIEDGNSEL